ncbi:MAG: EamA family transporter [Clostridia bacterium]|nr:EamA family transporter [Clostridia bacterium]
MLTVVLVGIMLILYSFQTLFMRLYSDKYPGEASVSTYVYTAIYGVSISLISFAIGGFRFSPSPVTVMYGVLNALALTVYNYALIKATTTGSYAVANLSMLSGGILVSLFQFVVFYDGFLTLLQYAGIAVMLLSFLFINADGLKAGKAQNSEKKAKKRSLFPLYCAMVFLANGLYGAFIYAQQTAMQNTQRSEMVIITYMLSAIVGFIVVLSKKRGQTLSSFRQTRISSIYLAICCLSAAAALNLYVYVMTLVKNIAVLNTIDNGGILAISAIYAYFIFREKMTPSKLTGIVLAIGSIVMLSI